MANATHVRTPHAARRCHGHKDTAKSRAGAHGFGFHSRTRLRARLSLILRRSLVPRIVVLLRCHIVCNHCPRWVESPAHRRVRVSYCILQQLLYGICCLLEQFLKHRTQCMQFFCTSRDTKVYNISQQITQHISKS